ncbi:MAG: VCBS repeat-containing protein, partial [Candidatus Gracilibacteria bacterium]|nr:VCBS repeat-containing protein [Candidatus Gracilibacteria bacterium]
SGKILSNVKSNILTLKSRGDALNVTSYNLDNNGLIDGSTGVKASDKQNVFIIDGNNNDINNVKSIIKDASSSNDKLVFDLKNFSKDGKKANLYYPIKAELYKDSTKLETISIPSISSYKSLFSIKESGDYKIYFTDSNSSQYIKDFQVTADTPNEIKVNMSTNSTDVGGVVTNHIVSLYDKYGNINSGELYNIEASISGNSVVFDDGNKQKTLNGFEGYNNFKLKSTDSSGESEIKFVLKDNSQNLNLEKKVYIKTVSDIKANISIENENDIKVGGNTYKYKLEIKDSAGNLLTDFNSKAYLNIDSVYGSSLDNVININSGIGEGSFKTTTIAGKSVNLNFSVEGLKNSISRNISIHPDKAMKIDMILANSKLEATSTSSTNLALELKDRYGNLVFDDNSTKLKLEIPDSYKHILNFSTEEKQVSGGKTNFTINATDIPGIAYLKVSSNPNLRENSFSVNGQTPFLKTELNNTIFKNSSGLTSEGEKFFYEIDSINYRFKANSLELLQNSSDYLALSSANKYYLDAKFEEFNSIKISGVGENAIKLETYYFWNKSKIIDKKYNSLYTALLGASYGDFTKKDYLAGAMLFDENNRSLAVSSLLNTPLNYSNLITVSPSGNITQNNIDDLTQDISITYSNSSKNLNFNIFNKALNTYIGKIYFKGENNLLPVCTKDDIDDCYSEATGIFGKLINSSYKIENIDDKVVLKNENGNTMFSISKDLKIENNGVSVSINSENTKDYLLLDLDYNGETIASIGIKLNNSKLDLSRDEGLFTNKINTISEGIFVFLQSYNYGTTEDYTATSTNENKGISIYYNDPFSTTSTKTSTSVESNSFANFENKAGIGWEGDNKTLLLLSSGENVGDATKNYQSLSSINLGDPVISLAKKDPKLPGTNILRKFDSSIGQLLGKGVKSYAIFDYNNDGLDDIVYLTDNGFIKLYEQTNTEEKFIDKGNLFYLADIDDNFPIIAGDFTGDHFDDVFFVDTSGKPVLLNNDKKHFSRVDLYDKFVLNSRISQIVGFDMNNDKKYDLVSLDEEGDINIFYGGGNSWDPQFTKNKIDSGYALKLNSKTRTDLRAIYFDGIYQLPIDSQAAFLANSEKLNRKIKAYNEAVKADPTLESSSRLSKTEFNEDVIDKLLFLQLNYDPENIETITSSEAQKNILSSMPNSLDGDTSSISSDMKDAKTRVSNFFINSENLNPNGLSYSSGITNSNKITTFLRSEYSPVEGVTIKKTYNDKNGNYLKSGDKVNVKVEITNNKTSTIKNVSYLDKIPEPLSITDDTIFKFKKGSDYKSITPKSAPDGSSFDFMIDHFDLAPSETVTLEYDLETQSFLIGYIKAGLFEKGELGDDSYGDIIVKNSGKNCG